MRSLQSLCLHSLVCPLDFTDHCATAANCLSCRYGTSRVFSISSTTVYICRAEHVGGFTRGATTVSLERGSFCFLFHLASVTVVCVFIDLQPTHIHALDYSPFFNISIIVRCRPYAAAGALVGHTNELVTHLAATSFTCNNCGSGKGQSSSNRRATTNRHHHNHREFAILECSVGSRDVHFHGPGCIVAVHHSQASGNNSGRC